MNSSTQVADTDSVNIEFLPVSLARYERSPFISTHEGESEVSHRLLNREPEFPYIEEERLSDLNMCSNISSFNYATLFLIGISSLWPWNCFISAVAYFSSRLESNIMMRENISSCLMASSTIASTVFNFLLSYKQDGANYSRRAQLGQYINICVFCLLALSCVMFTSVDITIYFVFLLVSMVISSIGTGLLQNGTFAIFNTFGEAYVQVIMVGQGVAGILPPITLIMSILIVNSSGQANISTIGGGTTTSSMLYFLTASAICSASLMFLVIFFKSSNKMLVRDEPVAKAKVHVPLLVLLKKLKVPGFAVFFTFMISLVFPVFAANIFSLNGKLTSRVFSSDIFIPFSFLVWNCGDLSGRMSCSHSFFIVRTAHAMTLYSLARLGFLPLFFLCNIKGLGALVPSDFFYLALQFFFGFTNGQLSSSAIMCSRDFVSREEQETSGGFMVLILSLGLAAGSLLSFFFVWLIN